MLCNNFFAESFMNTSINSAAVYLSGPTFVAADFLRLSFVLSADYIVEQPIDDSMQKSTTSKGHSHSARPQVNYAIASIT